MPEHLSLSCERHSLTGTTWIPRLNFHSVISGHLRRIFCCRRFKFLSPLWDFSSFTLPRRSTPQDGYFMSCTSVSSFFSLLVVVTLSFYSISFTSLLISGNLVRFSVRNDPRIATPPFDGSFNLSQVLSFLFTSSSTFFHSQSILVACLVHISFFVTH
jgi:hypothetical protein